MTWGKTSRHSRGYGTAWDRVRRQVLKIGSSGKPAALCAECLRREDRPTVATHADHIVPKANGGTDDIANIQPLCADCHKDKTAREAAEAQGRRYRRRPRFGVDGWPAE